MDHAQATRPCRSRNKSGPFFLYFFSQDGLVARSVDWSVQVMHPVCSDASESPCGSVLLDTKDYVGYATFYDSIRIAGTV